MPKKPGVRLTAVPSLKSSAGKLRVKQRVLMGLIAAGFLCGPLALWRSSSTPAPVVQNNVPLEASSTPAVEAAAIVAEDFLSGRPSSLPTAADVPQNLGRTDSGSIPHGPLELSGVRGTSSPTQNQKVYPYAYIVTFSFRADTGVMYKLNVVLHSTTASAGKKFVLAAAPSLEPYPVQGAVEDVPAVDPGGAVLEQRPGIAEDAVNRWARAYIGGDPGALKQEANTDGDPGNQFAPLSGFSLEGAPEVLDVRDRGSGAYWVARVRLTLKRDSFLSVVDYDVLIKNDGVGRVVAWGTPGEGVVLQPQGNAVR